MQSAEAFAVKWQRAEREVGAEGWAFGYPSPAVVTWCPSAQPKAGFDKRGTSVADATVEQRLRLSKILSKESVSTKWKQLHRCTYKLARTTRLVACAAVWGFGGMGRDDITSTPIWALPHLPPVFLLQLSWLSRTWSVLIRLNWVPVNPKIPHDPASPVLELQAWATTPVFFTWVLRVELRSHSYKQALYWAFPLGAYLSS